VQPPIRIREAALEDVPALAELHVKTFHETHGVGPDVPLREHQWREKLAVAVQACLLAESPEGELVGFANAHPYLLGDLPYDGQLEKIYVLRSWQGRGIGRRLVAEVSDWLLKREISSMLTFSEARLPAVGFFEHLGGVRLIAPGGEFHGGFGWPDLRILSSPS